MGHINIEIPDELHEELKVLSARRGDTIKEVIVSLIADEAGVELEELVGE